jgi:hypothetical protein
MIHNNVGARGARSFVATIDGEARLLLLIDAFSGRRGTLQGRTKLAKLDFLLRYPSFFYRAMTIRNIPVDPPAPSDSTIAQRMVRFRYGPWDPAYYALLGSLFGRGLIQTIPMGRYIGFRTTESGHELSKALADSPPWMAIAERVQSLKRAFPTQGGTFMKDFIYENFPEVTQAVWGERL